MSMAMNFKLAQSSLAEGNISEYHSIISQLAASGHAAAQEELGFHSFTGSLAPVIPMDHKVAFYWYQEAAKAGRSTAQYTLGQLYEFGSGTPTNANQAFVNYKLSAGAGYPKAQVAYALAYMDGQGVSRDVEQCLRLLNQYSDEGNDEAQVVLGKLFCGSDKVLKPDLWKAFMYFMNASIRGNNEGAYLAARILLSQPSFKRNMPVAYSCLIRSAHNNIEGAIELFRETFPQMTEEEVNQGQAMYLEFEPSLLGQPMAVLFEPMWRS